MTPERLKYVTGSKQPISSFVKKTHEKGLDRVVKMVSQRDFVEAKLPDGIVQCAAAHFCAHGAGILLFPVIKNNRTDLGLLTIKTDVQRPAQRLDR